MTSNLFYLKGINGLRAIAAISVVVFHINRSLNKFGLANLPSLDLAGFGVTIFFSISGFLITMLLLKEKEKQIISIKNFYLRRVLRIWPLYFLIFILSLLTAYMHNMNIQINRIPFYIFMAANIPFVIDCTLPFLGHFWSIGVEEQFYLFWPLIMRSKINLLKKVCLFTSLFFLLRVIFRLIEIKYNYTLPYLAIQVTRFDCISIGAIVAILIHQNNQPFMRFFSHWLSQLTCWAIIVLLTFNSFHIASVIDQEIVAFVTAIIILNCSFNKKNIINLENKLFNFLGKISYGIYLTHQLIIFYFSKILNSFELDSVYKYPLIYIGVISITIFVSYLSYKYFELPFLKLKEKFTVIKSADSFSKLKTEI